MVIDYERMGIAIGVLHHGFWMWWRIRIYAVWNV